MEPDPSVPKSKWKNYLTRERRVFYMPWGIILMWLIWVCYMVGFRLSHVNQMNTSYKYTYLEPSYAPGNLTSGRNDPLYITEVIISVVREFVLLLTFTRLLFFRTAWVINAHIFFLFFFMLFEAANAIMIGLRIENCNKEANNPCNSYKWCGIYGINSTTCPQMFPAPVYANTTALPYVARWTTPLSAEDLTWNLEFSISFFLALYMTLLSALLWLFSVLSRNPTKVLSETYEVVEGRQPNSFTSDIPPLDTEYNSKFK